VLAVLEAHHLRLAGAAGCGEEEANTDGAAMRPIIPLPMLNNNNNGSGNGNIASNG